MLIEVEAVLQPFHQLGTLVNFCYELVAADGPHRKITLRKLH